MTTLQDHAEDSAFSDVMSPVPDPTGYVVRVMLVSVRGLETGEWHTTLTVPFYFERYRDAANACEVFRSPVLTPVRTDSLVVRHAGMTYHVPSGWLATSAKVIKLAEIPF